MDKDRKVRTQFKFDTTKRVFHFSHMHGSGIFSYLEPKEVVMLQQKNKVGNTLNLQ